MITHKNDKVNKLDELTKLENANLPKLIENYFKLGNDITRAYKATFEKTLWKTEQNAKKRAKDILNTIEFIELKNKQLEDLRELYKDEIANSFNLLNKIIKDETYDEHEHFFNIETKKITEYKVKKTIPFSAKLKAAEMLLKTFNYFNQKQEVEIKQITEFDIIDEKIDNILEANLEIEGGKDE